MQIINIESSFTELFSLLKCSETLSMCNTSEKYTTDEILIVNQHAENAMTTLLQGLQDLGVIISIVATGNKEIMQNLHNIGYFISAISNLIEALDKLRSDASYILDQMQSIE